MAGSRRSFPRSSDGRRTRRPGTTIDVTVRGSSFVAPAAAVAGTLAGTVEPKDTIE